MSVITISRQFGSGGDEVAVRLCQILKYRLFDKRQVSMAAVDVGLSEQEIIDYSEENFKVKGFWDRLFGRSTQVAEVSIWKENVGGTQISEKQVLSETVALTLVQKSIKYAYQTGNFVIIGRGGQMILRDCPDALHIRIEAPMEIRLQRVKVQLKKEQQMYDATIEARREAQDLIVERDTVSAAYIKQFYGADWADPLLYHAILNLGKFTIDQSANAIVDLLNCINPKAVQ
jgi:CMP/dCMP kinase